MSSKRILAIILCVVLCCNNLVYALDNDTNNSEVQVEKTETVISPETEKEDDTVIISTTSELDSENEEEVVDNEVYEEEPEEEVETTAEAEIEKTAETEAETTAETEAEATVETETETTAEAKTETTVETETEATSETETETTTEVETETKIETEIKTETTADETENIATESDADFDADVDEKLALKELEIASVSEANELLLGDAIEEATPSEVEEKNDWMHGYSGKGRVIAKNKKVNKKSNKNELYGDTSLPDIYDGRNEKNPNNQNMSVVSPVKNQMLNVVQENDGSNIILKQSNRGIKKDKFSAFIYGLYWIKQEEDKKRKKKTRNIAQMMFYG